ncbi:hypothetical protein ACOME3_003538 [Neoechinorhynchus agilis]
MREGPCSVITMPTLDELNEYFLFFADTKTMITFLRILMWPFFGTFYKHNEHVDLGYVADLVKVYKQEEGSVGFFKYYGSHKFSQKVIQTFWLWALIPPSLSVFILFTIILVTLFGRIPRVPKNLENKCISVFGLVAAIIKISTDLIPIVLAIKSYLKRGSNHKSMHEEMLKHLNESIRNKEMNSAIKKVSMLPGFLKSKLFLDRIGVQCFLVLKHPSPSLGILKKEGCLG